MLQRAGVNHSWFQTKDVNTNRSKALDDFLVRIPFTLTVSVILPCEECLRVDRSVSPLARASEAIEAVRRQRLSRRLLESWEVRLKQVRIPLGVITFAVKFSPTSGICCKMAQNSVKHTNVINGSFKRNQQPLWSELHIYINTFHAQLRRKHRPNSTIIQETNV